MRAELVTLQSRTGQAALVYRAHLIGTPMRILVDRAYGAHRESLLAEPHEALRALEAAPLGADAAGMAILACLGPAIGAQDGIACTQEEGHATSRSPLPGRSLIAAPLWCGSAIAGSVALLTADAQMKRATTRARYITALMDAAAVMSGQLTRGSARRAS
ncbi:hypothetical protein [Streptomyces sp. NPDC047525]|uniref:hypothetical protein n=1 Tax=Streptomyces sp. NPDC047525 TaxID=3155264 RepID=UPI0033EDE0B3